MNNNSDEKNKSYVTDTDKDFDTDDLYLDYYDDNEPQHNQNKTHFYERIFTTEDDEQTVKSNTSYNNSDTLQNNKVKLSKPKNDEQYRQYALVSFIVGLCAIITLNIILAIISIIFANNSISQNGEKCLYTKTGYICSIITIIGSVLLIFIILIVGAAFGISFQNIFQNILSNIF